MSILDKIFGSESEKKVKSLEPIVKEINAFEAQIGALSDQDLAAKTAEFKTRLEKGETLNNILPEAFASVREAAKRTLGQRHFDVQLIGGMSLHKGGIAEMRTGEGKTLVATLPAYLNALSGKGVHVVTVNDYLSQRDAVWMGQVYSKLGMKVGVISHESSFLYDESYVAEAENQNLNIQNEDKERDEKGSFKVIHEFLRPVSRIEAYEADITYGANSEFGFDYLRDNLEYESVKIRQKEHNFAIIDEVDSILIDEARTPLIISAPAADSDAMYKKFSGVAAKLQPETHYTVDEKMRAVFITDEGIGKAEEILGIENIYAEGGVKLVHHLETALKAKALYNNDKEYVVRQGEVIIVDPFTGRMQPGRRWSEGLHQAIEAKEGVDVQKESRTYASITYQNYFRMYSKLSGMTGTAQTSKEEFYKVYGLDTVVVPPNKASVRADRDDLVFQSEKGKWQAIARKVKDLQKKGQPVLIGTISIENNELLGEYLKKEGVVHEILNAKNHEREAEIIAQAGQKNKVTIATNMAGRGVDIKLGGNPATVGEYEEVKNLGGLFVLGTERHDARRIDNQLRGRSGRQGDPGETQFFVSMEDHIMRVFASDMVRKMMGRLGIPEDEPIVNKLITRSLENAQEKIEGLNFDARKHILEYDDVLNFQRKTFYERRRKILTEEQGEKIRQVKLQVMDMFWVEHLEMMDYLRSSVNLRAYGQRDPLVEYKREGLKLFKEMEEAINKNTEESLSKISEIQISPVGNSEVMRQAQNITNTGGSAVQKNEHTDIGRNDPCWCGSGKKFKKCHGK
jgi:preprotein translocase subunit SecA